MSSHEITAELQLRQLSTPAAQSGPPARVTFAARTDLGRVRDNNEDKFDWVEPEAEEVLSARGRIYAVADGMGGHEAGQIASEVALKTAVRAYYASLDGAIPDALLGAIQAANGLVWELGQRIPGRSGMGTTLTALVLAGRTAFVGHVGDSRLYRLRAGSIEQITEDHSWVAEQVKSGALTAEAAAGSPYRNVITRSIGAEQEVAPDLLDLGLEEGDLFLLCSDGLSGVVRPEEMADLMAGGSPSLAAWRLIDLANDRGGPDNVTCAILRIDGWDDSRPAAPQADEPADAATPAATDPAHRSKGWRAWKR